MSRRSAACAGAAAGATRRAHQQARRAWTEARSRRDEQLPRFGALAATRDPAGRLADAYRDIAATHHEQITYRVNAYLEPDDELTGRAAMAATMRKTP